MIKINNPTFGSDFEMFVRRIDDEVIVPCPIEFGGTKADPLSIGEGCFRQIDGVAAEFNIPIVTTTEEWVKYYEYCINKGNEILAPLGMELVSKTSHEFDPEQFTHDRHTTFGCSTSFCAYDFEMLQPNAEQAGNLRTTGAHIHVGFEVKKMTAQATRRFIFCMDKCVGIPSLQYDEDTARRTIYGQAGEFREKMVGNVVIIEYRSIGGGLITPEGIPFLMDQTLEAVKLYNSEYQFTEEEIENQRNLINNVKTKKQAYAYA